MKEDDGKDEAREFLREFLLKLSEADETNQQILYVQTQILQTNVELIRAISVLATRMDEMSMVIRPVHDFGLDEFEEL